MTKIFRVFFWCRNSFTRKTNLVIWFLGFWSPTDVSQGVYTLTLRSQNLRVTLHIKKKLLKIRRKKSHFYIIQLFRALENMKKLPPEVGNNSLFYFIFPNTVLSCQYGPKLKIHVGNWAESVLVFDIWL